MSKEYLLGTINTTIKEKSYGTCWNNPTNHEKWKNSSRTEDFILVWDEGRPEASNPESYKKRRVFEDNLRKEHLELKDWRAEDIPKCTLRYVKIHAPLEVLQRYAEVLKLRLPMTKSLDGPPTSFWQKIFENNKVFPNYDRRITAVYSRDKEYLFDSSAPSYFTPAVRSTIVQFILDRSEFVETNGSQKPSFGIGKLVSSGVYSAAYPLHDGDVHTADTMRSKFHHHWASIRMWHRYQPIDHIRHYFGVKIGLYFAWLGFYTYMLLPASVVGLACFLVSLFLLPYDEPTKDICSGTINAQMCPSCDYFCNYWDISKTCSYMQFKFLFDNYTTVFFAVFMSFWAAIYLEMWKRYSAEITHRWDLTGFDTHEEHPRPQYLRLARPSGSDETERDQSESFASYQEPRVSFWKRRLPFKIFSYSVVMLLVLLAIAAVIGVTLYRMSVTAALRFYGHPVINSHAMIITSTTAATINLVCIFIFNWMYTYLAEYLTELEMLRTQSEFDNSLTLKMYLLQFVNYYASIFYIAFCKGKLVGFPAKYSRLFGYRQEECGPGGCLLELSIQLAIIMVGKQAFNSCLEMVYPIVWKWWNSRHLKQRSTKRVAVQWEKDYKLVEWGSQALFPEYLEMVLQYGFVTIFVSAFPLAPLFALLNNILESRLDAKKLVTYHRRPVAQRVKDIGVWFNILDSVSKLAVITNGFIIAFTSDFVPRLVYKMSVSPDQSLTGYMNYSLAYVDVRDLDMQGKPNSSLQYCRFNEYREPPWSAHKYEKTTMYWHVLAARFAFVVLFENLVVVLVLAVQWLIPDVPAKLREQIRREAYLTNEIIITQEAQRVCKRASQSQDRSDTANTQELSNCVPTKSPDLVPNELQFPQNNFSKEEIRDAAMIHRPQSFGEICEEVV